MVPPLSAFKIEEFSGASLLNPYHDSVPGPHVPVGGLHISGLEDLPPPPVKHCLEVISLNIRPKQSNWLYNL